MWQRKLMMVWAACCLCVGMAQAQSNNLSGDPGYFDFGQVPGIVDEPKVQIDLNPLMLGFIADAAEGEESGVKDVLKGLRGIKVYVYELTQGRDQVLGFIDAVGLELEGRNWMRMVYIDSDDTKVRIHVRPDGGSISGMTLMVLGDDNEAVFMNIVGDINPAKLGKVVSNVGIDGFVGDLGEAMKQAGAVTE